MRILRLLCGVLGVGTMAVFVAAWAMTVPVGDAHVGPGTLAAAAPMSVARSAHSATALPGGHVLIAGGFVEQGAATGAELFDPSQNRFVPLPPMVAARHSHSATILPDGRVLIAGGFGAESRVLSAVEVFDPATNTFAAAGTLRAARGGHVAVLLDDGTVLIAGGVGPNWQFLSSAERYDPATGRSTAVGDMMVEREGHVAVGLRDGRVLVAGGHRGRRADITLHASAELFDPATGRFTRTGDMRVRRHKHDAVLLPSGAVLVTGGSDERDDRGVYRSTERFDPVTGRFTDAAPLQLGRYKHAGTSVVLPSGLVLIGGGAPRAELYDPEQRRFNLVPSDVEMAGQFAAVAALPDGGALITGGYGNRGGPRPSAWRYRP